MISTTLLGEYEVAFKSSESACKCRSTVVIWSERKQRFMCGGCRREIERPPSSEWARDAAENILTWLLANVTERRTS